MTTPQSTDGLDLAAIRRLAEVVEYTERCTAIGFTKPDSLATVRLAKRTLALLEEVERLRRVGICGDRLPTPFANTTVLTCDLLAGHDGWHGADNATTFGYPATRCSWTVDEHGPIAAVSALSDAAPGSPVGEP